MNHRKLSIQEMNRLSTEEFRASKRLPIVVVLDNIRSQHNIGAVFRTADAFSLSEIWLCGICCCPPNQEIHKTALGAEETVPHRYYKEAQEAVKALHKEGYTVYAIEQAQHSVQIEEVTKSLSSEGKYAIVLGHEVFGVQQEVIDECDDCIEIPQYGTKHSLNVSVTAGIVMYELSHALRSLQANE